MSIKNKLNRLKTHMIHEKPDSITEQNQTETLKVRQADKNGIPFLETWKLENTSPYYLDNDFCLIREVEYPLEHLHGKYAFKEFLTAMELWKDFPGNHPLSGRDFEPSDLFFFDTETTGLGGGTGNTIFLLGYASIKKDKVILKQHILYEPGAEVPLYYSFLENINYTTLVTYNGKAFDWPQVKTRHTLIRDHVPKLPKFGHFDLYHGSRRMWKDKLESVKLANVEKEILGFERKDDIPGFLAPMIYFDFVERKNPEGLIGILKHNEYDILSLISLYTHLTFQILQKDPHQTSREKRHVGKWFDTIGDRDTAFEALKKAADENDHTAKHELAFYFKRNQKYQEARKLWMEAAEYGDDRIKMAAYIELAKLMEHQFKDVNEAIRYTKNAIQLHKNNQFLPLKTEEKLRKDLDKRFERLWRKRSS